MIELLKTLCLNDRVYPGLDPERHNTKRLDDTVPLVKPETVPHLVESGWTIDDFHELRRQKERTFLISC